MRRFLPPPQRRVKGAKLVPPIHARLVGAECGLRSNAARAVTRQAHIATLGIQKVARIDCSTFAYRSSVLRVVFRFVVRLHVHAMVPLLERKRRPVVRVVSEGQFSPITVPANGKLQRRGHLLSG